MLIIGIAGGTGSGKTTVVRRITANFDSINLAIIPQDNYYKDHSYLSELERQNQNFDHPDAIEFSLLEQHLQQLRSGSAIQMPHYSYLTCSRLPETTYVEPKPVIIVEGMMALLKPSIVKMLDIKIFVDAEDDDRIIRCIQRDINERGRTFEMVVERYYKTVKPMHRLYIEPSKKIADLIIPHGGENQVAIDLVSSRIEVEIYRNKQQSVQK